MSNLNQSAKLNEKELESAGGLL